MEELGRKSPEEILVTEKKPIIIILDDVRSMHNVGSSFRTCDEVVAYLSTPVLASLPQRND